MNLRNYRKTGTELVFGFVGPIGADRKKALKMLTDCLKHFKYTTKSIKVSDAILKLSGIKDVFGDEQERLSSLMDAGNDLRAKSGVDGLLGFVAAQSIGQFHDEDEKVCLSEGKPVDLRRAFVVDSIKHPDEVAALREVYGKGFYLIALHVDQKRRLDYLVKQKGVDEALAEELLERDEDESEGHGQSMRDAFHLADFFLHDNGCDDKLWNSIERVLNLIFGNPQLPPTFNEFAMYSAFVSAMRSADLSRQVGAVIAQRDRVISTGANEVPAFGGGQYWSTYDHESQAVVDDDGGRDFKLGYDSNSKAKERILDELVDAIGGGAAEREALGNTSLADITEYGRAVHAEMDAILSCARSHESTSGASIYVTTYPCHNCAKHLISAGIRRVFYIEPYPKSRALELHGDAMSADKDDLGSKMVLRPFVGVGPRQFASLFSSKLGEGHDLIRKSRSTGEVAAWEPETAVPRMQMLRVHYRSLEAEASELVSRQLDVSEGGTK